MWGRVGGGGQLDESGAGNVVGVVPAPEAVGKVLGPDHFWPEFVDQPFERPTSPS